MQSCLQELILYFPEEAQRSISIFHVGKKMSGNSHKSVNHLWSKAQMLRWRTQEGMDNA